MTAPMDGPFRQFAAALVDEACRRTGLSNGEIAERLRVMLGRATLNRQSIGAWRSGAQSPPTDVFMALLKLADSWGFDAMAVVVTRHPSASGEILPTPVDRFRLVHDLRVLGLISDVDAEAAASYLTALERRRHRSE